jgi:hypothetical protein
MSFSLSPLVTADALKSLELNYKCKNGRSGRKKDASSTFFSSLETINNDPAHLGDATFA